MKSDIRHQMSEIRNLKSEKGQIALPIVLLIGGIVVEIGIISASFSYILISSGYGERLSAIALAAAHSGIQDAFLKLARNKDIHISSSAYDFPYSLGRPTTKAKVKVEKLGAGRRKITSTGEALLRKRKLEGFLSVNETTGKLYFESLAEVPL